MLCNPFVSSGEILRIIGTYKMLDMHIRPSELIGLTDPYLAFCFDECCAYILKRMQDGEEPIIKVSTKENPTKVSKPSDIYNKYK